MLVIAPGDVHGARDDSLKQWKVDHLPGHGAGVFPVYNPENLILVIDYDVVVSEIGVHEGEGTGVANCDSRRQLCDSPGEGGCRCGYLIGE